MCLTLTVETDRESGADYNTLKSLDGSDRGISYLNNLVLQGHHLLNSESRD